MDKNARVEENKSPSLQSGKKAAFVKKGQALALGEKPERDERDIARRLKSEKD